MPPQTQSHSQPSSTTKLQPNLLIPQKRPLLPPSSSSSSSSSSSLNKKKKTLNPSSQPAHINIIKPPPHDPPTTTEQRKHKPIATLEVDLSGAPQPFLDPGAWLNMKVVAEGEMEGRMAEGGVEGVEGRERREREREAGREFGGMAVWSRRDVRRRTRRDR